MRKVALVSLVCVAVVPAIAAKRLVGTMTLKDSQPYGIKDKEHKHQAYDLSFAAQGKNYTCRTEPGKSTNATDFVVGASMEYRIDGNKVEIKTPRGKDVKCKVVRVEVASPQSFQ